MYAPGLARPRHEHLEIARGQGGFEMAREGHLDRRTGKPRGRGELAARFEAERIAWIGETPRSFDDGEHAPFAVLAGQLRVAHPAPMSSSTASAHPRGSAPGKRP